VYHFHHELHKSTLPEMTDTRKWRRSIRCGDRDII
jgi:hypothetical protein